jgi:hypothetical protein
MPIEPPDESDVNDLLRERTSAYWAHGSPSDDLLMDFAVGIADQEHSARLEKHLQSNARDLQRLRRIESELFSGDSPVIAKQFEDRVRGLIAPEPRKSHQDHQELTMYSTKDTLRIDSATALGDQIRRVIKDSAEFIYVTNFFGGMQKAAYETGHSDLKFAELEPITTRILEAVRLEEHLDVKIVVQDFEAVPGLIHARQRLRNDTKYMKPTFEAVLAFVAREISDVLHALDQLCQLTSGHPTVKIQLRATKGLVSFPAACSPSGAAVGMYLSNLSDFFGPTQWFEPESSGHLLVKDHCSIYLEDSFMVLGDDPHWRARNFLKLGMDKGRLLDHLMHTMPKDPVLFPEHYADIREMLGPEF